MNVTPCRAYVAQEAEKARRLWIAVLINAVRDVSVIEHRAARKRRSTKEDLRRWLNSADGREVVRNAGYEPSHELTERIVRISRDPGETGGLDFYVTTGGPKRTETTRESRYGEGYYDREGAYEQRRIVSLPNPPWA